LKNNKSRFRGGGETGPPLEKVFRHGLNGKSEEYMGRGGRRKTCTWGGGKYLLSRW